MLDLAHDFTLRTRIVNHLRLAKTASNPPNRSENAEMKQKTLDQAVHEFLLEAKLPQSTSLKRSPQHSYRSTEAMERWLRESKKEGSWNHCAALFACDNKSAQFKL
jgi:hypothetical protein